MNSVAQWLLEVVSRQLMAHGLRMLPSQLVAAPLQKPRQGRVELVVAVVAARRNCWHWWVPAPAFAEQSLFHLRQHYAEPVHPCNRAAEMP